MSRENVEVVREGWDAWLRGDLLGLFRTFDLAATQLDARQLAMRGASSS